MPFDKKWSPEAERDLAIAIILSQQGERAKYDWPKVHNNMKDWKYEFSQDAISQHWTKSIMKSHKARTGDAATRSGGPGSVPSTPGGQVTPTPKKGSKRGKDEAKLEGAAAELVTPTPNSKKRKTGVKKEENTPLKKDEDDDDLLERERSVTMPAGDRAFEAWYEN